MGDIEGAVTDVRTSPSPNGADKPAVVTHRPGASERVGMRDGFVKTSGRFVGRKVKCYDELYDKCCLGTIDSCNPDSFSYMVVYDDGFEEECVLPLPSVQMLPADYVEAPNQPTEGTFLLSLLDSTWST
eukprot:246010-Pyramimonas_sp.AAC.1